MNVEISPHARDTMAIRGATEAEVLETIRDGQRESARLSRVMYRKNFAFDAEWEGQRYRIKQVAPVVAVESDRLVVVTVYVFYF